MAKEKIIDIPAPRENARLFGHRKAQAQFVAEAERGLLHHAYLMTGPKGIGKATLAYRFARYILSRGAVEAKQEVASLSLFGEVGNQKPEAGNQNLDLPADSPLFRRIAGGSHADLLTISPAFDAKKQTEKATISVEEARKVPEFLSLTPAEGDWRVVIVDAVDQLNSNAANALLKILEEPPARAILFLICHQPGGILPTIRSRCRQFALQSPTRHEFDETLSAIAPSVMMHEYTSLYALSGGSPGYAITLYATDGVQYYRQWLEAISGDAATRKRFTDSVAAQKSPEIWRTILHGWNTAITRINLWPHTAHEHFVLDNEATLLAAIAESLTPDQRARWRAQAAELLNVTDVFNLDKRQTITMLLAPALLDRVAA